MKSPQKENGYTAIANEIMDYLCKYPIPASQRQCLDFILRKTYGFNKKEDAISFSQFEGATNIDRRHVNRALNELLNKRIIKSLKGVAKNGNRDTTKYCFNKSYTEWVVLPKKARGIAKAGKKVLPNLERTKDTLQKKEKNIPDSIESGEEVYKTSKGKKLTGKRLDTFNIFWEKFNHKHGKADAADSWLNIPKLTLALCEQIYTAAEITAKERPYLISSGGKVKWAQGWLTSRRWEDEITQNKKYSTIKQNPVSDLMND